MYNCFVFINSALFKSSMVPIKDAGGNAGGGAVKLFARFANIFRECTFTGNSVYGGASAAADAFNPMPAKNLRDSKV